LPKVEFLRAGIKMMKLKNPLAAVIAADQALPSCLLYQNTLDVPSTP